MTRPELHTSQPEHPAAVCFILGILRRSGTNYIFNLLRDHPDIQGHGPIWEDFTLHHSGLLREFAGTLFDRWEQDWNVPEKVGPKIELQRYLGEAVRAFLKRQLPSTEGEPGSQTGPAAAEGTPRILITKTPSVEGIKHFFEFFPQDYLIAVVRDGRAVVESGVRSFGWDYEAGTRAWAEGARQILDVSQDFERTEKKFLLVKYEDVYRDEEGLLRQIFSFLGLDPERYPYGRLPEKSVLGSSDLMKSHGKIHWKGVKRTPDFDPLSRFSGWNLEKHALFNRIAGEFMAELGYDLHPADSG